MGVLLVYGKHMGLLGEFDTIIISAHQLLLAIGKNLLLAGSVLILCVAPKLPVFFFIKM